MTVTIDNIPVFQALVDDEGTGMLRISLVDSPAVMSDFLAFREEKIPVMYRVQDEEKQLVRGVVMRADFPIYRRDARAGEYYIIYKADTIRIMAEKYRSGREYGVFLFHDRYDIPAKAADHERLGESENIFEYLICAVCPVSGDYEPGEPECGFLFPAYSDGGALMNCIDIYQADEKHPHEELENILLGK